MARPQTWRSLLNGRGHRNCTSCRALSRQVARGRAWQGELRMGAGCWQSGA